MFCESNSHLILEWGRNNISKIYCFKLFLEEIKTTSDNRGICHTLSLVFTALHFLVRASSLCLLVVRFCFNKFSLALSLNLWV